MNSGWNFAEIWERLAARFPDAPALVHGDRTISWKSFDERANGLAASLLTDGAIHQDKVALYLYNSPEYMEATFALYKSALVPVNTNYRYVEDELAYLWDNADAVAVIFHGSFASTVEKVRQRVPKVKTWIWVDDGSDPCPEWATPYELAATPTADRPRVERSGDDIVMIYTGGTTGMPKGVMWRQDDLIRATCSTGLPLLLQGPEQAGGYDGVLEAVVTPGGPGLPACPLMHGTGWFTANIYLCMGGSVVTLVDRKLNIIELLDTVEANRVTALTIVGDAFAKPIVHALDADPGRWDLSSLVLVTSSGVMWSEPVKEAMLRHNPHMLLIDAFSSSEAIGLGQSASFVGSEAKTAKFTLGENSRVITEDGRDVVPGSGEKGRVAVGGTTPLGYYKDPEKSAATFTVIDGKRFSMPGDWATVDADGTINLLGRGSVCINTGGEKVFPEEVEEALKEHATVYDAVVVGVPDEKFGEVITAIVEPKPGVTLTDRDLIDHVKTKLAAYKAPKRILPVESIGRAANGKVDYARWKAYALESLA